MTEPGEGEKKPAWRRGGARPAGSPAGSPPGSPKGPKVPPPPEDRTFFQTPAEGSPDDRDSELAIEGEATFVAAPKAGAAPAAAKDRPEADVPSIPGVTITRVIGRGGMGIVYEGTQGYLDRRVAVKLLLHGGQSEEFTRRFQREAKILAALSHPNVVSCYQAGVAPDGRCFLVMEYIDGPTLGAWIEEHGALDPEQAVSLCRFVASALGYAHQSGIIHRDVKPANVLLKTLKKPEGGFPFRPTLADLGLARVSSEGQNAAAMELTVSGTVMGSPPTMAPEQFDAPDKVDFRTDIYGLGCVLFHCLTGKLAFPQGSLTSLIARKTQKDPPDPRALRKNLPRELSELVRSMIARKPQDRPASYEDLLRRLEGPFVKAKPARSSGLATTAAAFAVVAIGGWMAVKVLSKGDRQSADLSDVREEPEKEPEPLPEPHKDPSVQDPEPEQDESHSPDTSISTDPDVSRNGSDPSLQDETSGEENPSTGTSGAGEDPVADPDVPEVEEEQPPDNKEPEREEPEVEVIREEVLVLPVLPAIKSGETWALLEGENPLEDWKEVAGRGGWASVEETRNGAEIFLEEGRSAAARGLPHPPWKLSGRVEMAYPTKMDTKTASVLLALEKGFAIELRQGIEGENALLAGSIVLRRSDGRWEEVQELQSLTLAPMSRSEYKSAAPAIFTVSWDAELLSVAWSLGETQRRMDFTRADLVLWGAPIGLEIELETGYAIFSEFVVEGP